MAIVRPLPDGWGSWLASRPAVIQDMAKSHPPDRLYRMKDTGHRCTLYSYNENGTVTVDVTGEYNRVLFGRRVFGVAPSDLEECELPRPEEDLGDTAAEAGYSEEDVRKILIPEMKRHHMQTCSKPNCTNPAHKQ